MKHVLVADDDLEMLAVLADALTAAGHAVTHAADGAALIDTLADHRFDLVVTDISMPWMTGLQATHSARYAGLDTPILVITALGGRAIADRVAGLGERVRLLRKPFTLEALHAAVAQLLAA
jgi:CheY-like chemotaxis protein